MSQLRSPLTGAKGEVHSQIFPSRRVPRRPHSASPSIFWLTWYSVAALPFAKLTQTNTAIWPTVIIAPAITTALCAGVTTARCSPALVLPVFPICRPFDGPSFHGFHRCNQMRAARRAWCYIFWRELASPLSTPIRIQNKCHGDVSFLSD